MLRFVLFFIVAYIFYSTPLYSQNDTIEWAPIGAKWWYTYSGAGLDQNYLTLESVKDTLVQDKNCRLIEIQEHLAEGFFETEGRTYYFENIDFGPRRIILHQQGDSIFYLRKNKFELLYDFSMTVGDTIAVTVPQRSFRYTPQDTQLFVNVESNFTTNINGQTLRAQKRKISFESGHGFFVGDTVIEKIGDNVFFLPYNDLEYDAIAPYQLRCYQDDSIFYKAVDMPCDSITPLESSNLPLNNPDEVLLYPNPVGAGMDYVRVNGIQVKSWMIWDLRGRLIYQEERDYSDRTIKLPPNLKPGLYFLELRSDMARYVKQFIVR